MLSKDVDVGIGEPAKVHKITEFVVDRANDSIHVVVSSYMSLAALEADLSHRVSSKSYKFVGNDVSDILLAGGYSDQVKKAYEKMCAFPTFVGATEIQESA